MMKDDMTLVREFAASQSEEAFATLVSRHLNLVYSVAMQQTRDAHLAEEIAQAVFIILARKAGSLSPKTILSGWLYRTACYAAADALKRQRRRQHYEQEAHMQSTLNESSDNSAWQELSPLLAEAMTRLGQTDRDALVLRYFQNKSLREVANALGVEERAAQKRVARGLEKLRSLFAKRGVALTTVVIAGTISANSVQAAPVGLAGTIAATAVKGTAATASTLTLVKGALKLMAWTKVKIAAVLGATLILTVGATTTAVVVRHQHGKVQTMNTSFPRSSWHFAGYGDPESAFQSAAWAMSQGDVATYRNSLVPGGEFHRDSAYKTDAQVIQRNRNDMNRVTGFTVTSKQIVSADEIILGVHADGIEQDTQFKFQRIAGEWKLAGSANPKGSNNGTASRLQLNPNRPQRTR